MCRVPVKQDLVIELARLAWRSLLLCVCNPIANHRIPVVNQSLLPLLLLLGVALASLFSGAAMAAGPEGEWLVAERTAQIKIADCGGMLWGIVSWEADPGVDERN